MWYKIVTLLKVVKHIRHYRKFSALNNPKKFISIAFLDLQNTHSSKAERHLETVPNAWETVPNAWETLPNAWEMPPKGLEMPPRAWEIVPNA